MNYFDAKISTTKTQSGDIQYFAVICHADASEEQLLNVRNFIIHHSLRILFKSPTNQMWIVALRTEEGNYLQKLKGIKLVGGVNIDSKRLLEATQPIIITEDVR